MANKTALRLIYEGEVNKTICDKTWSRIKRRLRISENFKAGESKLEVGNKIKAYAYLYKTYPNRAISADTVERFLAIQKFLSSDSTTVQCTGKDIYELVNRLSPRPSDSTIYRWGEEMDLKFSKTRLYQGDEAKKWIEKIATNPKFKYFINNLRTIQSDGQNQRAS